MGPRYQHFHMSTGDSKGWSGLRTSGTHYLQCYECQIKFIFGYYFSNPDLVKEQISLNRSCWFLPYIISIMSSPLKAGSISISSGLSEVLAQKPYTFYLKTFLVTPTLISFFLSNPMAIWSPYYKIYYLPHSFMCSLQLSYAYPVGISPMPPAECWGHPKLDTEKGKIFFSKCKNHDFNIQWTWVKDFT